MPIPPAFLALSHSRNNSLVFRVGWGYFSTVFNDSDSLVVSRRDKRATWCSTGEIGVSKPRLVYELQSGLPYRTYPPNITIDWHSQYVLEHFDVTASQLAKFVPGQRVPPIPASAQIDVGIEVWWPLAPPEKLSADVELPKPGRPEGALTPRVEADLKELERQLTAAAAAGKGADLKSIALEIANGDENRARHLVRVHRKLH